MGLSRLKNLIKRRKKFIAFLVTLTAGLIAATFLINGFLELREELNEKDLAPFDDAVAGVIEGIRSPALTKFFKTASMFGDQEFYLIATPILAGAFYYVERKFSKALRLALVLIVAALLTTLLKDFIERPRPHGEHLVQVSSYSFPSGHTVSSVAFYGFLIYVFLRSKLQIGFKIFLTILLCIVILSIAFSRIYLGVHYTTDVIAGLLAGGFFLLVFILAFYITRYINKNNNQLPGKKRN